MPPATDLVPAAALEQWPTFTRSLEALDATDEVEPIGCCRTNGVAETVKRKGIEYFFESTDAKLARRVADLRPAVVHLHGLGFTRLLMRIRRAVGRSVPILMQHHGEPVPMSLRTRLAQRMTRRLVDGYLYTGAVRQAEPFRRIGVIGPSAPVYEALESASHLVDVVPTAPPNLSGSPRVLWVGRLIPSKDPLCAVRAIAAGRERGSEAHLHMLATDRSLEPEVRKLVDSLGLGEVVRLHPPVEHHQMADWYASADVYLSTSHREGSNYSLIEALGFGCFPVVTDIPSHEAIVQELARRFSRGDADAAGELIAASRTKSRETIADYAQRCVSWTTVADQLVEIYRTSLKS